MEKKIEAILITFVIGTAILFLFAMLSLPRKVQDLEKRIDELEKENTEVHEYILNRIGG